MMTMTMMMMMMLMMTIINKNDVLMIIDYDDAKNKQLLDEVFVICRIINVEVRVISRAEGEADNSYRDIDNSAYHKNRIR